MFIIMDEAHNMFRGISNANAKSINIYNKLIESNKV